MSDHLLVLNCWVLATARSLSGPLPDLLVAANSGIFNFSTSLIFGFYNATFITQFLLMMDISLVHEMGDNWIIASFFFSFMHCLPGIIDILLQYGQNSLVIGRGSFAKYYATEEYWSTLPRTSLADVGLLFVCLSSPLIKLVLAGVKKFRFRSEVLYSNRLRQDMVTSVMKRSGHFTTMAMFSMAGLAFFIGYIVKNVKYLLSHPPTGVILIFFFITLSNFSSFMVIPSIKQFYLKKIKNFFRSQHPLSNPCDTDRYWAVPGRKVKKLQRVTEILDIENIEEGEPNGKGRRIPMSFC